MALALLQIVPSIIAQTKLDDCHDSRFPGLCCARYKTASDCLANAPTTGCQWASYGACVLGSEAPSAAPVPLFSADRYPTGVEQCSWLNWIADRTHSSSIAQAKEVVVQRIRTLSDAQWTAIGNGVIDAGLVRAIEAEVRSMNCTRDETLVARCVGLSDIGCQFRRFASNDSTVMYNKTDGAVASPPNHKVVAETAGVRVINVYCPPSSLELAFHTHTRLSFWISWGTSRGEIYWGYDGSKKFDQPLWDRKEGNTLRVMWNGPEWFHMIQEKEPDNAAAGNCATDKVPACPNGFKYRVELKLDDALEGHDMMVRR